MQPISLTIAKLLDDADEERSQAASSGVALRVCTSTSNHWSRVPPLIVESDPGPGQSAGDQRFEARHGPRPAGAAEIDQEMIMRLGAQSGFEPGRIGCGQLGDRPRSEAGLTVIEGEPDGQVSVPSTSVEGRSPWPDSETHRPAP